MKQSNPVAAKTSTIPDTDSSTRSASVSLSAANSTHGTSLSNFTSQLQGRELHRATRKPASEGKDRSETSHLAPAPSNSLESSIVPLDFNGKIASREPPVISPCSTSLLERSVSKFAPSNSREC